MGKYKYLREFKEPEYNILINYNYFYYLFQFGRLTFRKKRS